MPYMSTEERKRVYAEKLAKIQERYQRNVVDAFAAMSPEERKRHSDRGMQVARETMAEWRETRLNIKALDMMIEQSDNES